MKVILRFFVLSVVVLGMGLLWSTTLEAASEDYVVIGTIQDLSGPNALCGQSQARGVEMAVEDFNQRGGLLGKQIVLKTYDFKLDVQEGINAYRRLVNQDKACVVVGPPVSNLILALAPIAEELKVPIVGEPSDERATTKSPGEPWGFVFASQPTCKEYGYTMAGYAIKELGLKKFGVIYNKANAWGAMIAEAFMNYAKDHGAEIVSEQTFLWGDTDFRAQLTKIKDTQPDALVVPEYLQQAAQITKQAREMGMMIPIVGPNSFTPPMVDLIGSAANNIYFVNNCAFDDPNLQEFIAEYKEKYGVDPTTNAFFGYDNTLIALNAIERAGSTDPVAIRNALAQTKDVKGLIYTYTFDPTLHRPKQFVATVIKIVDGKYITVGKYLPEP